MGASGTPSDDGNTYPRGVEIHAPIDIMRFADLLDRFLRAPSSAEGRRIVEQHPELLGEDAAWMLNRMIDLARAEGNAELVIIARERRALLRRCREIGVAAAFGEL